VKSEDEKSVKSDGEKSDEETPKEKKPKAVADEDDDELKSIRDVKSNKGSDGSSDSDSDTGKSDAGMPGICYINFVLFNGITWKTCHYNVDFLRI
jgi:hypothetical protein